MPKLSPGLLGHGTVINGISIVLRPFQGGYRIYANHRPCNTLPYGGYVRTLSDAQHTISRYQPKIISLARRTE